MVPSWTDEELGWLHARNYERGVYDEMEGNVWPHGPRYESDRLGPQFKRPESIKSGYHGTAHDLTNETEIQPGSEMFGPEHKSQTYFSPEEDFAWDFALTHQKGGGRPKVAVTKPIGTIRHDDQAYQLSYEHPESLTADRQEIKDISWIPTVPAWAHGVQGTLPVEDWRKYGAENFKVLWSDEPASEQPAALSAQFTPIRGQMKIPGLED